MENPYSEKRLGKYWAALGEFAYYFARLENDTLRVLVLYTKTPKMTARALFSGTRLREAMSFIRRTAEANGEVLPDYVEEAFSKIATINTMRDKMLHHGIEPGKENFEIAYISDERRTIPSKAMRLEITIPEMQDLIADTIVCWARMIVFTNTLKVPQDTYLADWTERSKHPWRYKSVSPSPEKQSSRPKKLRARPQKSSPE